MSAMSARIKREGYRKKNNIKNSFAEYAKAFIVMALPVWNIIYTLIFLFLEEKVLKNLLEVSYYKPDDREAEPNA